MYDLRSQFKWWEDNYGAYQGAMAAAGQSPPDFSTLPPPPLPGWHRIKEGHFISIVAYGWLCDVVIEDYPSHAVTNRIILSNPPKADQDRWNNLVAEYYDLKPNSSAPNPRARTYTSMTRARQDAAYQNQNQFAAQYQNFVSNAYQNQVQGDSTNLSTNSIAPKRPRMSPADEVLAELQKFPEGTNYTIDLFACKLGYLQDGSHRQVYDLGQMRAP
jgi:hypothetical protein